MNRRKALMLNLELDRRALDPQPRVFRRRQRVVAAVDFDHRELRRVEPQPIFRARAFRRVEASGRDQALVGPGRCANQDPTHRRLFAVVSATAPRVAARDGFANRGVLESVGILQGECHNPSSFMTFRMATPPLRSPTFPPPRGERLSAASRRRRTRVIAVAMPPNNNAFASRRMALPRDS